MSDELPSPPLTSDALQRELEVTVRDLVNIGRALQQHADGALYPINLVKSRECCKRALARCTELLEGLATLAEAPKRAIDT